MKTGRSPFRAIDEKVFEMVDQLRSSQAYERYVDVLSRFTDAQQQRINTSASLLIAAVPLLFAGTLLWGNLGMRSELAEKRTILSKIESFERMTQATAALERHSYAIRDKNALITRMGTLNGRASINQDDVTVLSFTTTRTVGGIRESSGRVTFKNLSTKQLGDLLSLLARDKFAIATLDANKAPDGKSVQGSIGLVHVGKHEP